MSDTDTVLLEPSWANPGDKWFRTAYKWNRGQIFDWMAEMAAPGGAGPQGQAARDLLTAIRVRLVNLSLPKGSLYIDKTKKPDSHISRNVNLDWKREDETQSKFHVSPVSFRQTIETVTGPVPDWWCPYDLLGLFLSLLGPAPPAADKYNFYLPLTAVYGRWCARIAGKPEKKWKWNPDAQGEGPLPFVFQCTWIFEADDDTKKHWGKYFLGASTAGDRWESKINPKNPLSSTYTGSWRERVQEARFNMLFKCQKVPMVMADDFSQKRAPNMNIPGRAMVPFGNCGETYPFAMIFSRNQTQNLTSMSGLALQKNFMGDGEYADYKADPDASIWKNLMAPCANCTVLITRAGATWSKFDLEKGQGTPPKPFALMLVAQGHPVGA